MAFPVPLISGTLVFVLMAVVAAVIGVGLRKFKRLNKDEGQIYCVSIIVATVCLWLMWICTWLHQWNPIIFPTLPAGMEGGNSNSHH